MRTKKVDLERQAQELREQTIPELEEAAEDLLEKIENEYDDYEDVPKQYEQTYNELQEEITEKEGQATALKHYADEWGDGVFVLGELTTGQIAQVQDKVAEQSFDFDPQQGEIVGGMPKRGFGMVETLRHAIQVAPDGAPVSTGDRGKEQPEPGNYPSQVGMFLFEKANNLNTTGDTDLGNSSLRSRMTTSNS